MSHQITDMKAFLYACQGVMNHEGVKLTSERADTIVKMLVAGKHWPTGWMAYGLATAFYEAHFTPQDEWGKGQGKPYGLPGRNRGQVPFGRGLVQITHDDNYERFDAGLGLGGALIRNYSLANDPDIAVRILVWGMEHGKFTQGGRKLGKYIGERGTRAMFTEARRIINGQNKAEKIATYALGYQDALDKGRW